MKGALVFILELASSLETKQNSDISPRVDLVGPPANHVPSVGEGDPDCFWANLVVTCFSSPKQRVIEILADKTQFPACFRSNFRIEFTFPFVQLVAIFPCVAQWFLSKVGGHTALFLKPNCQFTCRRAKNSFVDPLFLVSNWSSLKQWDTTLFLMAKTKN